VHTDTTDLDSWVNEFKPQAVCVTNPETATRYTPATGTRFYAGTEGLARALAEVDYDLLVNGIVGAAGLAPSYHALAAGRDVATANKESLVIGGELLSKTAKQNAACILPIDSEHSAIWQCLKAGKREEAARLWLTASGGPFRTRPADTFSTITVAEALGHPTWKMGDKITIDSATLMNKGFEIIEAYWLFGIEPDRIAIVVHPESIIHSAVEFADGSVIAQMGWPDMQLPIQYALLHPDRIGPAHKPLDLRNLNALHFEALDTTRFPGPKLARQALQRGGDAPVILNAANEVAVRAFLDGGVPFSAITDCVAELSKGAAALRSLGGLADIYEADRRARDAAYAWLAAHFDYHARELSAVD
jgi:1-deoxy-D-xylulose-5-phosphate reductoisomerase